MATCGVRPARRGPRRLDAWRPGPRVAVRDIALAASGLLDPEIGGPSVHPLAPAFLFEPPASYGPKSWKVDEDSQRYRRALYTFRFRSVPYPMLQTFDTPPGDSPCPRRVRSNTPLQALTTLNEPVFMECAQALAKLVNLERLQMGSRKATGAAVKPLTGLKKLRELDLHDGQASAEGVRHASEIRSMDAIDELADMPAEVKASEVALAEQVIGTFTGTLDLADYRDDYQEGLREIIDAKIAGREIVAPDVQEPPKVVNLMEALRRSLDAIGVPTRTPAKSALEPEAPAATRTLALRRRRSRMPWVFLLYHRHSVSQPGRAHDVRKRVDAWRWG